MPILNFIQFVHYSSWEIFMKQYLSTNDSNGTSDNQTDIRLTDASIAKQEQWLINVTSNLNHLILCDQELPSVGSQLAQVLNKKIRRLGINQSSQLMQIVETSYIYFSNVQYIDFPLDLLRLKESLQWYADIIMKIFINFENLETLSLYYPQPSADNFLITKFLRCLDINEINKQYRMEKSYENTLFLKK
jgi:hypothetical protein